MFDLNEQAIQRTLSLISTEREVAIARRLELNQQVASLKREVRDTEALESGLNNSKVLLRKALVVLNSWPTEIMKLKERVALLQKEASREDILVSEKNRLQSEIARVNSEVADKCQHPFVIGYRGWEGSYSYDYDNGYRGKRLCVICGFYEYSDNNRLSVYTNLQENENRLVDDTKLDLENGYDNSQSPEEIISGWIPKRVSELQTASQ